MIDFEKIVLVNYCYPDCTPLMNIMRLPKSEAFKLAEDLAKKHPETTAFYRFADFDNYYAPRKSQDRYLYDKFVCLGGRPEEAYEERINYSRRMYSYDYCPACDKNHTWKFSSWNKRQQCGEQRDVFYFRHGWLPDISYEYKKEAITTFAQRK